MSEQTNETPFRYTAAMAQQIETAWQDRWEEEGTFNAPNPAGPWAEPEKVASRGEKLAWLLGLPSQPLRLADVEPRFFWECTVELATQRGMRR